MDVKQANVSETDTGFKTSGCGSVCIQVVLPYPKVHKLATRSRCMDVGCISNKLDTPKSIHHPIVCSYKETVNQRMRVKCTLKQHLLYHCNVGLSGMEGLRQQYSAEDLSYKTIDLLESNRRPVTLHHYKTGWKKWGSWCVSTKIYAVSAGINFATATGLEPTTT